MLVSFPGSAQLSIAHGEPGNEATEMHAIDLQKQPAVTGMEGFKNGSVTVLVCGTANSEE